MKIASTERDKMRPIVRLVFKYSPFRCIPLLSGRSFAHEREFLISNLKLHVIRATSFLTTP